MTTGPAAPQSGGDHAQDHAYERVTFERVWQSPTGFPGALSVVNNQPLGKRFMITALGFFFIGGVLALLMRIQLAIPHNDFLGPEVYNQLFTMHGSTMMYLFAVPFMEGLALYLLPQMLGSRDVAFPRLTAFGYWCYLFGGGVFYASFIVGAVPDAGWFAYTPLSTAKYTGLSTDFWLLGLSLVEIAGLTAAAEIVVTILKLRAPGMTLARMPLFAWAMLATGVMILFAFTPLLVTTILLELDRTAGTQFFDTTLGGSSLLWQHLFWFFGHPEVYISFLPATGIVSMVIAAAAGRAIVGHSLVVVAILLTGFVSFGLWVHHMFATGLPELSLGFFTAASLMVAIASGIQVFAWIATLWGSRPRMTVPLWFTLGFLFIFVAGGMTGVMVAIVPFDWQVHDTYFVVAHFHYVLIGGVVFPVFAGLHHWGPKITGRLLHRGMGLWSFWLTFIGFNVTFFPMHIMGFLGLPRRVYTYPAMLEVGTYNLLATAAAFMLGLGFGLYLLNLAWSLWRGPSAGANPWNAESLEWSLSSPPASHSFDRPPLVLSRAPLWPDRPFETMAADLPWGASEREQAGVRQAIEAMHLAPTEWRGTLRTDLLTAKPEGIYHLAGPSYLPLVAAIGLLVAAVGVLIKAYFLSTMGVVVAIGGLAVWLWPDHRVVRMLRDSDVSARAGLPIYSGGRDEPGWWGMLCLVTTLGVALASVIFSYFYLWLYSDEWPQGDLPQPDLLGPGLIYLVLLATGLALHLSWRVLPRGRGRAGGALACLGATLLGGAAFLVLGMWWLWRQEFSPQTNAYASAYFVISGFLLLYVLTGLVLLAAAMLTIRRYRDALEGFPVLQVRVTMLYWYFVVLAGIAVYLTLYVSPHLI